MVSVLFVDLVGFTTLSESRDAEDVRELLTRYFDTARTIVGRYGGMIEKFIGDAVMAVWGAPVAREDDAERAVRAGLELVDAVAMFGAEVGAADLRARAGVVTGRAATLGEPDEGRVTGDSVNTAARVQSTAQPGSVCVDDVTRQVTSSAIAYADAGEHTLKGRAEPVRLWRAERVVAGVAGALRSQGIEAPFIGRDPELRLVKELFHTAVDRGTARLVAVSGAAGVGKSRLCWEFDKYIDGIAGGVLWHRGGCLSYGDGVAYSAFAEMVRARFAISEDEPEADARRDLAAGLERWVMDTGERDYLAPRLGALLGIADQAPLAREELFAGWRLFLERLSEHHPVVLCFEDFQWADAALLDFVEHVLEWSSRSRIFIVTFARPELAERREGWGAGRRAATPIYLEPLAAAAMGELLDAVVDGLPRDARERIVDQAEGIPLYAVELVRALADRGALAERDGRYAVAGELGELDVPASLSSLLAARLDGLAPEERDLVKAMSVFGGVFPRGAAVALGEVPEDRIDDLLAVLVRKDVLAVRSDPLSPDRGQYSFAQTMLRTVAYDMLSKRERKPRHLAAAQFLRTTFPDDGEDFAEVIAAHYLDAYRAAPEDADAPALRAEAVAALRRAGRRAARIGAPEAAEHAYRGAMELVDDDAERAELTAAAGEMARIAGHFPAALELLDAAAALHVAGGREHEAARLQAQIAVALRATNRVEEGAQRLRTAIDMLGPGAADADVAALNGELARALMFTGAYDEVMAPLEIALRLAEALELRRVLCTALITKGTFYMYHGRWREGLALIEAVVPLARESGEIDVLLRAQTNIADTLMLKDRSGAREHAEEALAVVRRIGDRWGESIASGNLMYVLLLTGRWEEIDRLAHELLRDDTAERAGLGYVCERLLELHVLRGDVAAVRADLAGLGAWRESEDAQLRGAYRAAEGLLPLVEGRPEVALETLGVAAREALAAFGAGENARGAWTYAVEAALAAGRIDEAAELVELLAAKPAGAVAPYLRAQLRRARARIAAARGDHDHVEPELAAAIDAFAALDYRYWLAHSRADLAAWLLDTGRAAEAAPLLDAAIPVLEALGAAPALERARALVPHRDPAIAG